MWKYIVLNSIWFSILFLVHFFGSKNDRRVVVVSALLIATLVVLHGVIDPFAWLFYVLFSVAVFSGAGYFKYWAFIRLDVLTLEIEKATIRLSEILPILDKKRKQTEFLEKKGDEIVEFYEQIKEMSKSLDRLETFLIFSEALSEYFRFDSVKLGFFNGAHLDPLHPEELYELKGRDFGVLFDRSTYLRDRKRAFGEVFPFDQKVYRHIFKTKKKLSLEETKIGFFEGAMHGPLPVFTAVPILIHEKICAILTIVNIDIQKDPLFNILLERFVGEIQRVKLYEKVEKLAITDGLTAVYVRRHLMERMDEELDRAKRFNLKFSFLMIDIDFFKSINDERGHLIGDVVLKQVATAIKQSVREVDFVGRYGGEEFGVGLIETDGVTAQLVAERIRRSIEHKKFKAFGEEIHVCVSIGCVSSSPQCSVTAEVVEAADAALYQAKRLGRNRVSVA